MIVVLTLGMSTYVISTPRPCAPIVGIYNSTCLFGHWMSELDSQHIWTRKNVNENVSIGLRVFIGSPIKVHILQVIKLCRRTIPSSHVFFHSSYFDTSFTLAEERYIHILFNLCWFSSKALCAYCGHLQLHVPLRVLDRWVIDIIIPTFRSNDEYCLYK